jgi:hypothetical protein
MMGFLERLFKEKVPKQRDCAETPAFSETQGCEDEMPNTLSLGWYWSEGKQEFQMAKIAEKDRATHFYVIGASGTGKTKFLEFLIRQDIEKGNGLAVIDPHGDLIEDIKGYLACQRNLHGDCQSIDERLVLIDPTDPLFTVTFNPLERLPNISVAEQANELVGSFRKIWSDSWGVRMEDLMRNTLIALGEAELTLAELPAFLTKRGFREVVLRKITHPIAKGYFERFDNMTDRGQAPWIEPVMNKFNAFMADERIRQMFSSSTGSSFNVREIMDQQKILLVKLDKGRLKDAADLLGSLIMAKIQLAAFSRTDIPQRRRTPFYCYVDEFQNFASESFAVILSEARKYGLSLIMAHQTLSQVPEELRSLILGNTGIQVCFRINRHDASILAKEAFEYSGYEVKTMKSMSPVFWSLGEEWERKTEELQTLAPRCCYVKHKIEGGLISIETDEIESPWEAMGVTECQFNEYVRNLIFGGKYLISRKELLEAVSKRQESLADEIRTRTEINEPAKLQPDSKAHIRPDRKRDRGTAISGVPIPEHADLPVMEGKGGPRHRYLQTLIKRVAEEKGYRAIIEEKTPGGSGSVDVGLTLEERHFACEISITTSDIQELGNLEKCLAAGYDKILLCMPDRKSLEKMQTLVLQKFGDIYNDRINFFQPEELFFFLEQEAAKSVGKEERVKGYKVKVQYQPVKDMTKKTKREAIGQVIVQAMRRLKNGN